MLYSYKAYCWKEYEGNEMVKSTSNEENSFHLKQKKKKVIELAICQISAHNDSSVATH